jgi:peptide/nickel transport system substrate-binding protein
MTATTLTKRWYRALALLPAAALLAAACSPGTGGDDGLPPLEEPDDAVTEGQREAPELAQMVEAGDLPPMEERLPTDPHVVDLDHRLSREAGS